MKRRQFLSGCAGLAAATVVSPLKNGYTLLSPLIDHANSPLPEPDVDRERQSLLTSDVDQRDSHTMTGQAVSSSEAQPVQPAANKNINFEQDYDDDIFLAEDQQLLLQSVFLRFKNLQKTIGYGNFNLVSFDDALRYANRYGVVGDFTDQERTLIDELFNRNAVDYGFYGDKVTHSLTARMQPQETIKIPQSGHYLFKGESLAHYERLKRDVGDSIILTSGIRSNVKQLYLFIAKTVRVNGNLSRASRSLAPPGYSYHGVGDFDVGRIGWGAKNFTDDFATTDEYKKMQDLGYIAIRYDHGNSLGVRFEPWHIKVTV